ncbi:FliH/SctL family protein [Leifsonia sp. NPDC056824]|uniref:FliH/SctL family protein n=1 Tax=Leifsonia sp. NPDC056824 TaxID=3345953 RepID=UPI0036997E7A
MSNSAFAPVRYPEVGPSGTAVAIDAEGGASSARARGFAAGYSEGLRRAEAEHQAAERARLQHWQAAEAESAAATRRALAALAAAAEGVRALAVPVVATADDALVEAALALAEAVLQREVADGHVDAADTLRRVIAATPAGELVSVRMHPDDARAVAQETGAFPEIVPDPSIAPSDAVAVLRDGWLDARIDAGLARARTVLTGDPA